MSRPHIRFDEFHRSSNAAPVEVVVEEGALVVFGAARPVQVGDFRCTPLPVRTNYVLSSVLPDDDSLTEVEAYLSRLAKPPPIERKDIPEGLNAASIINNHRVTAAATDSEVISCLVLDDDLVQQVQFLDHGRTVEFFRHGAICNLSCEDVPVGCRFALICEWRAKHMAIGISWLDIASGEIRVLRHRVEVEYSSERIRSTQARIGPAELVDGGGSLDPDAIGTPRVAYADIDDLYRTVFIVLSHVAETICLTASPSPFWDQGEPLSPKTEPRCGHGLRLLMETAFFSKRVRIWQEAKSRSGNSDFCITGVVASTYSQVAVCLEIKRAQSDELEHGLTVQLPIYMEEQRCDVGIYGVFWFKGDHCQLPTAHASAEEMRAALLGIKPPTVRDIIVFDVSRQPTASQRQALSRRA